MGGITYTVAPDGKSITCHLCRRTSHHPRDAAERYCGHCHTFHEWASPSGYPQSEPAKP